LRRWYKTCYASVFWEFKP